jgi:ferredoxin
MTATVKTGTCIGCGLCVDICPDMFAMDEETDVATTKALRVPAELKEKSREAATNCPVEAIVVEE